MASVLKSNGADTKPGPQGVTGFNLDDFASSSRRLLEQTQSEAQRLIVEAQQQAAEIERQAHRKGLASGLAEARKTNEQEIQQRVQSEVQERLGVLEQTASQLSEQQSQWLDQCSQTLTAIAIGVAEKILLRRLEKEPEIVLGWTEQALRHARSSRSLVVAVHPETLVQLGQPLEALLQAAGVTDDARLEPDESLEPGGVVVRQHGGSIDVQLSSQLANLQRLLQ